MKGYFYCFFGVWMVIPLTLKAQDSRISGCIKDNAGLTVESVNVILLQLPDSTEISVVSSDSLGLFAFESVRAGAYVLVAMQIGYEKYVSEPLRVKAGENLYYNLPLVSEYELTDEITVSGKRPVIRQEPDKMVVDVENSLSNSGLSVVEVLRKSPGISVNKDGIITLKGRNGVLVMLDDKPLYMTEEQVGNLLKSIPSDQVKELEIITSPSAKYDAAGNAGIINIKLKKGAYEGFNGSINASYGQGVYHKANAGVNAFYKKKKLNLSGGYQYNNKNNLDAFVVERNYTNASSAYSKLLSDSYYRGPQQTHNVNTSATYNLNDKTSLSLNLVGGYSEYGWDGGSYSALYKRSDSLNSAYNNTDVGVYRQTNINAGLGSKHKLDTLGTELSFEANFNSFFGISNKDFRMQNYDSLRQEDGPKFLFLFRDPSYTNLWTAKTDFTKNLWQKVKMEAGAKVIASNRENRANIIITENDVARDESNFFVYNEQIYAAYTTLNRNFKKFKMQLGLRMEHTHTDGTQILQDTSFSRDYTNWFPSGNLTYEATAQTSYTLRYSRRIRRPNPWELNPVLAIVDPFTSWGGNPYLLPEYTDQVEFSQSFFSGVLLTTLDYSYTHQPIAWVIAVDANTLKTVNQPRNLAMRENAGLSVSVNTPIAKWWQSNNNVYIYYGRVVGNLGYGNTDRSVIGWNVTSTQSFTLSRKTSAEISGSYHSASIYGLTKTYPRGMLNLSVQQKIWNNKGLIKFSANDVFWTERWIGTATMGDIETRSVEYWDNRIFMLTFTYKFGKKLNVLMDK